VKYLPQRYFEELCNDHVRGDDSLLQSELREVIFSHIPSDERKDASSLEELIRERTEVGTTEASTLQKSLTDINSRIIELSGQVDPSAKVRGREELKLSLLSLRALRDKEPKDPVEPKSDDQVATSISQKISQI